MKIAGVGKDLGERRLRRNYLGHSKICHKVRIIA